MPVIVIEIIARTKYFRFGVSITRCFYSSYREAGFFFLLPQTTILRLVKILQTVFFTSYLLPDFTVWNELIWVPPTVNQMHRINLCRLLGVTMATWGKKRFSAGLFFDCNHWPLLVLDEDEFKTKKKKRFYIRTKNTIFFFFSSLSLFNYILKYSYWYISGFQKKSLM